MLQIIETKHQGNGISQFLKSKNDRVTEDNCTLQEMQQLEIKENQLMKKDERVENKIIRSEGDYDVSGHQHEIKDGRIVCQRRSAYNKQQQIRETKNTFFTNLKSLELKIII